MLVGIDLLKLISGILLNLVSHVEVILLLELIEIVEILVVLRAIEWLLEFLESHVRRNEKMGLRRKGCSRVRVEMHSWVMGHVMIVLGWMRIIVMIIVWMSAQLMRIWRVVLIGINWMSWVRHVLMWWIWMHLHGHSFSTMMIVMRIAWSAMFELVIIPKWNSFVKL